MNQEPIRLRDDPEVRADLRKSLARESASTPPAYDAAAGLGRLQAAIAAGAAPLLVRSDNPPAPADAPLDPRPFAPRGWIWKVGTIGLATVGAVISLSRVHLAVRSSSADVAPVPVAPVVIAPPAEPSVPEPATPPETVARAENTAPTPIAEPHKASSAKSGFAAHVAPRTPTAPAEAPADDRLRQEVANLAQIKAAGSDSARVVALADEGNRKFTGGILAEEREASAIVALSRLGRTAEADKRAAGFLERYPRSSFAERVRMERTLTHGLA